MKNIKKIYNYQILYKLWIRKLINKIMRTFNVIFLVALMLLVTLNAAQVRRFGPAPPARTCMDGGNQCQANQSGCCPRLTCRKAHVSLGKDVMLCSR